MLGLKEFITLSGDYDGDPTSFGVTGTAQYTVGQAVEFGLTNGPGEANSDIVFVPEGGEPAIDGIRIPASEDRQEFEMGAPWIRFTFDDGTVVNFNQYGAQLSLSVFDLGNGTVLVAPASNTGSENTFQQMFDANPGAKLVSMDLVSAPIDGVQPGGSTVDIYLGASDYDIPCFTRGTRISTPRGPMPIERLRVGSLVNTADHGPQPIRWIGRRTVSVQDLQRLPKLVPIRIRAGMIGDGLPLRDLIVSPQHRVLVRSPIVQRMFGASEVLVAAKHLTATVGFEPGDTDEPVEYWHLLLDTHEVVFAEGAATESLFLGPQAKAALSPQDRSEINLLFPELSDGVEMLPARILTKGAKGRRLALRHSRNQIPLAAKISHLFETA